MSWRCTGLWYHFSTAGLSSNQAKITSLPLPVRAVSTPRQPGLAFRAPTRSGKSLPPDLAPAGASAAAAAAATANTVRATPHTFTTLLVTGRPPQGVVG